MTPSELVGERLKELRRIRGWSAKQLAERCAERGAAHLTAYVIANLETKRRQVSLDDLFALAYACDVSPAFFTAALPGDVEVSITATVFAAADAALREWLAGRSPLRGMDEDFFASQGFGGSDVTEVARSRELLLAGSKRLLAQYDERATEFLESTRAQVRGLLGEIRQAVASGAAPSDLLEYLDDAESGIR